MRRLPSPFLIYALVVLALFGTLTVARGPVDADYYWHVTAGRLIGERGILFTDPFSYTWQGQPWVMHEWIGQLAIATIVDSLRFGATAFIFGALSVAGPLLVAGTMARMGVSTRAAVVAATIAVIAFIPYAAVRPQAISWVFIGLLLSGMLVLRPDRRYLAWAAVPLVVVWANVHGLYVVGLAIMAVYAAFTVLGRTPMAPRRWEIVGILAVAFVASMATPAGPAGLLYPLRYVDAGDWGLRFIAEWQSPDFHQLNQVGFLLLVVAVLLNGMRATPGWLVAMAVAGIVGGLLATRNVPIAAILATPTLAFGIADRMPVRATAHSASVARSRRLMELGVAVVIVAATAAILPSLPGLDARQNVERAFPVRAVDHLRSVQPDAMVFAEYGWGGYVINRLHDTGGRVFVDGRNDMYDETILREFQTLRDADPGWEEVLASRPTNAVLLPPAAPLVRHGLLLQSGWCEAYRDEVAVLVLKSCP